MALKLFVIYVPPVSSFFNLKPLSAFDLLIAIGMGALVFLAMEVEKIVRNNK